jgi:hypothetical protein
MAADSTAGFCAHQTVSSGKILRLKKNSGVEIGGPDGPQIPTPESVWGAESPIEGSKRTLLSRRVQTCLMLFSREYNKMRVPPRATVKSKSFEFSKFMRFCEYKHRKPGNIPS